MNWKAVEEQKTKRQCDSNVGENQKLIESSEILEEIKTYGWCYSELLGNWKKIESQ